MQVANQPILDKSQLDAIERTGEFELVSSYQPAGDQPQAIDKLVANLENGAKELTLLGVTGSGKTYTLANLVARLKNRPTMVLVHNKTLAAQLYAEFRSLFPHNAVEYFVSYYDYYQPEAYVPAKDLYIDKDSSINEQIEQLRLSATKSLMERNDVLIVATVSAIFGIGDPVDYHSMVLHLRKNEKISQKQIIKRLIDMQYTREKIDFKRGCFRVRGDTIDIFPAEHSEKALRIQMFDDEVEELILFDPLTGRLDAKVPRFTVFPSSHYVVPENKMGKAIKQIQLELVDRTEELNNEGREYEANRLNQRTMFDLEKMKVTGFCKGVENYSRHLSGRNPGEPPPTLFDYLPSYGLLFIDESHVTVPQVGGMYKGDRSRKDNLVEYGFRLPSALDNRPLKFEEFDRLRPQTIYVSATPADFETKRSDAVIEMLVRPTGLIDPQLEIRPASTQVDDLLSEIHNHVKMGNRVLVTTLTKRMAEHLTEFLLEHKIKVNYLHSDIDTIERTQIIHELRSGVVDVVVGINLLREGLDLPEVSLVAILDADKEGFLRSERSLIQTIGRAARNIAGCAILYADTKTKSINKAVKETNRRRKLQEKFNQEHNITPTSIKKAVEQYIESKEEITEDDSQYIEENLALSLDELDKKREQLRKEMQDYAKDLEFEKAAQIRDQIKTLEEMTLGLSPQLPIKPTSNKKRRRQKTNKARRFRR